VYIRQPNDPISDEKTWKPAEPASDRFRSYVRLLSAVKAPRLCSLVTEKAARHAQLWRYRSFPGLSRRY
jgi:hypothetical protein